MAGARAGKWKERGKTKAREEGAMGIYGKRHVMVAGAVISISISNGRNQGTERKSELRKLAAKDPSKSCFTGSVEPFSDASFDA